MLGVCLHICLQLCPVSHGVLLFPTTFTVTSFIAHNLECGSCKHKSGDTLSANISASLVAQESTVTFGACDGGAAGITARFGEDIFDRLKKEKSIQAHDVTASSGPDGWTLTEEARSRLPA